MTSLNEMATLCDGFMNATITQCEYAHKMYAILGTDKSLTPNEVQTLAMVLSLDDICECPTCLSLRKCTECGSTDIRELRWVNVNDETKVHENNEATDGEYYCPECKHKGTGMYDLEI